MPYYHDLVTAKSWQLLQELKRKHDFVLIGGWAVYLYTRMLKSKDIDIVVEYEALEKLRAHHELTKNDRLKKYEIHIEGIDIDIYVPFFSDLGLPVQIIQAQTANREGFIVPVKEILLALKQKAWADRGHSLKGEKDRIDIVSLLKTNINWPAYKKFLKDCHLTHYTTQLKGLLQDLTEIPELGLNAHQYAKLKREVLGHL